MSAELAKLQNGQTREVAVTPMQMIADAFARGADPGVLEKLMALQERWEVRAARKAYDDAMASAKAEIPVIAKNRTVSYEGRGARTNYRHEDLGEIARTVDPVLAKHGLSYRWRTVTEPDQPIKVTCIVSHREGHSEENTLSAGRDETGSKNSIQAIGSTVTYLQRYTLKAALGLAASHDEDGQGSAAPVAALSAEQLESLQSAIVGAGLPIQTFCAKYRIRQVADLPADQLAGALAAIDEYAKKKGQAK